MQPRIGCSDWHTLVGKVEPVSTPFMVYLLALQKKYVKTHYTHKLTHHKHTCIQTYTTANSHTHMHTNTHPHIYKHTHSTHTYEHMHTYIQMGAHIETHTINYKITSPLSTQRGNSHSAFCIVLFSSTPVLFWSSLYINQDSLEDRVCRVCRMNIYLVYQLTLK